MEQVRGGLTREKPEYLADWPELEVTLIERFVPEPRRMPIWNEFRTLRRDCGNLREDSIRVAGGHLGASN